MTLSETPKTDYVVIVESELRLISANAVALGEVETGGGLHGLRTHEGRAVIYLASPPGPEAIQHSAYFQQELHRFQSCNVAMLKTFGLQFQGQWHSHHVLGLTRPSGRDMESIRSIIQKNEIKGFVQLIVTHNVTGSAGGPGFRHLSRLPTQFSSSGLDWNRGRSSRNGRPKVRIDAFVFRPSSPTEPVETPLRVLPGTSPFRSSASQFAEASDFLRFRETPFPLEDISYCSAENSDRSSAIPKELEHQLLELPEWVLPDCEIAMDDDVVRCEIPLKNDRVLVLSYQPGCGAHLIRATVQRRDESEIFELAAEMIGGKPQPTVCQIFNTVTHSHQAGSRGIEYRRSRHKRRSAARKEESVSGRATDQNHSINIDNAKAAGNGRAEE